MNYTTVAQFIRFVGSDNMTNLMNEYSGAAEVLARQEQILNGAEGTIDGYADKLYTTPLPASYALERLTLLIARKDLYDQMEGDDIPKRVQVGYEEAIKRCEDIYNGIWKPPPGTDGTATEASSNGSSYEIDSDEAVFDEDGMEDF